MGCVPSHRGPYVVTPLAAEHPVPAFVQQAFPQSSDAKIETAFGAAREVEARNYNFHRQICWSKGPSLDHACCCHLPAPQQVSRASHPFDGPWNKFHRIQRRQLGAHVITGLGSMIDLVSTGICSMPFRQPCSRWSNRTRFSSSTAARFRNPKPSCRGDI